MCHENLRDMCWQMRAQCQKRRDVKGERMQLNVYNRHTTSSSMTTYTNSKQLLVSTTANNTKHKNSHIQTEATKTDFALSVS